MMHITTIAIITGVILDFIFGDPRVRFHPICLIGNLIGWLECHLRSVFPKTKGGELTAGVVLWFLVVTVSAGIPTLLLLGAYQIHWIVYYLLASILCYLVMATKDLKVESMKVYQSLKRGDLPQARVDVSMIVGRDTDQLDESGVAKAAVETVAENASDGCIAPLFYMAIGGPILGFFYKAVNTMDSMVAYKNEKYLYFGRMAAHMDDVFNFLPSRLAAYMMIAASAMAGFDGKAATRIHKRDHAKSPSPNSAQTETVMAGALHVALLGDTTYFGVVHHKEVIGDDIRPIESEDIPRANRILYLTVILATLLAYALRLAVQTVG